MENCKMMTSGKKVKAGIPVKKSPAKSKKTSSQKTKRGKMGMMQEKMAGSQWKPFMM